MTRILYVSWISDCPNLTLYSDTVQNRCNPDFVFDELLYKELKAKGGSGTSPALG